MIKSYWNIRFLTDQGYYKILKKGLNELEILLKKQKLMVEVINTLQAEK